ncbi:hypothetical protein PF008_g15600 [Phytophthora fragariae]|uniref:Uncharacterized protein n=1 Tax=Phytophthora fragariae TaxID=53985 RepID=A0A6G0RE60_9STRA|nr:hypothetical protein PF008_g15600 [Phytophthora fragariae]
MAGWAQFRIVAVIAIHDFLAGMQELASVVQPRVANTRTIGGTMASNNLRSWTRNDLDTSVESSGSCVPCTRVLRSLQVQRIVGLLSKYASQDSSTPIASNFWTAARYSGEYSHGSSGNPRKASHVT